MCATPVAYGGKPHNSLLQTRLGDEPCRAAQESHDFNRGKCQSDFVEQQGIVKGRAEGYVESLSASVANLVRSGTLTLDAALDVLQVSDDIRATVKENAEKALNQ